MSDFAVIYMVTWLSVSLALASLAATVTVLRWRENRRQRRQNRLIVCQEMARERVRLTSRDGVLWYKGIDRPSILDTSLPQESS